MSKLSQAKRDADERYRKRRLKRTTVSFDLVDDAELIDAIKQDDSSFNALVKQLLAEHYDII
ncbi:MAG: hypothetical protein CMJ75_13990 [Planctomycetaceae bacterium]|nr:hypothetical protein [Planctomycetaceae bacterium]